MRSIHGPLAILFGSFHRSLTEDLHQQFRSRGMAHLAQAGEGLAAQQGGKITPEGTGSVIGFDQGGTTRGSSNSPSFRTAMSRV